MGLYCHVCLRYEQSGFRRGGTQTTLFIFLFIINNIVCYTNMIKGHIFLHENPSWDSSFFILYYFTIEVPTDLLCSQYLNIYSDILLDLRSGNVMNQHVMALGNGKHVLTN